VPTGIVKLHSGLKETSWRYLMTWKRTAIGSTQASSGNASRVTTILIQSIRMPLLLLPFPGERLARKLNMKGV